MAPKNKKKNGFYFFMKEIKDKEARRGCVITMKSLPTHAHPIWLRMSVAEREPYEEMAKQYNNDPNMRGGKLASDGTRVEDNLYEEELKKRLENKMKQDVKRYCNSDCTTEEQFLELAPKKLFYFMSFNLFCKTDEDYFIPIEVGIVEYSIEYGIHRQYTKLIHPGAAPTGYSGIAKDISLNTHQISVFGEECSERDINIIYDEIMSFVSPTGNEEYPPVFSERKELDVTKGCIEWICRKIGRENVFEVWDASYLLMELTAGIGKPLPSYTIASDLLNKSSFDYHPSTRCEFHEENDVHYCALSYSKKLCYLMSDAVCKLFDVELTEKHIPTRAAAEKAYTVHVVKDTRHSGTVPISRDRANNYYQNTQKKVDKSADGHVRRQPTAVSQLSIANQMNNLRLDITAAAVPGHGIGRGIRRK